MLVTRNPTSRQDLEDLLNEPEYFQATFYSLPRVKQILQSQVELGRANEAIASKVLYIHSYLSYSKSFCREDARFPRPRIQAAGGDAAGV
jgi:hypothetical protein